MPDTGAPWNIPYVESSDLVSDWPTDSLALANAIDAGLDAAGNAGIGSNVVQTVKTDTYAVSLAQGAQSGDVTGLTAAITPTSDTSKVLVFVTLSMGQTVNLQATLFRDGSATSFIGDAANNRERISVAISEDIPRGISTVNMVFLDSPATTSSVTYSVRISHQSDSSRTLYVNRSVDDSNVAGVPRSASSITAIEVAA